MSTHKLSNVSLDDYRDFLRKVGCCKIRTEGGHEVWARKDLLRPIIVQTHDGLYQSLLLKMPLEI